MGIRLDNAKALYLEGIRDGDVARAVNAYTGDRYTQHSTGVRDGREGFVEFFTDFIARNPDRDIEIVRGFEDGQHVFVQAAQSLNGGEYRYVTADIFDTDADGKIIEHWDVIAEVVDVTVSGRSQVDGPTEITDLDKTEQNKELVRNFVTNVLVNGDTDKMTDYISAETYIQHNPGIGDGLEGLSAALQAMAALGQTMTYQRVHKLIGSGNFVVTLSAMNMAGTDMAAIDIFRVEDDKIVEHWDVMEPITPEDTWANSGKF